MPPTLRVKPWRKKIQHDMVRRWSYKRGYSMYILWSLINRWEYWIYFGSRRVFFLTLWLGYCDVRCTVPPGGGNIDLFWKSNSLICFFYVISHFFVDLVIACQKSTRSPLYEKANFFHHNRTTRLKKILTYITYVDYLKEYFGKSTQNR
jgi:hypothetical protein